eukprot:3504555-Amphidinium_carterae.1
MAGMKPRFSQAQASSQMARIKDVLAQLASGGSGNRSSMRQREASSAAVISDLQQMTEALVWGEKHDAELFTVFCEHQLLGAFVAALSSIGVPKHCLLYTSPSPRDRG